MNTTWTAESLHKRIEMENTTSKPEFDHCVFDIVTRHVFSVWFSVYLLLLPVFLLVLYIGFNKWRRPQSAAGGLSHSDVFTLHMVLMEMTNMIGSCVICCAYYTLNIAMSTFGEDAVMVTTTGQVLFHSLTCVERYLAVVHPVSYLRLRREGGATVRNICISLVWVLSVLYCLLIRFLNNGVFFGVAGLVLSIVPLPLVLYCSVYVLIVLTRPKPGEKGGLRRQVDQSKRSTVYTMVGILGALLLRMVTEVASNSSFFSPQLYASTCVIVVSSMWSILPSSLVLPLLFLHRAGQLTGCK